MKAAIPAVLALSIASMPGAHAQVTHTGIPDSPWSVSTIAGGNPACSMVGLVGRGRLSLTILGEVPGVVHLQLDKQAWSMTPGSAIRATFRFAGYPDVLLSGLQGGAASVLFNLTST